MKGLLLFLVAVLLSVLLLPVGFLFALCYQFRKGSVSRKLHLIAVSIDQLGNVVCGDLFNETLITKESMDRFGSPDETISSVLGKNQLAGTLSRRGMFLNRILHRLDRDHSLKAIEQECQ